jgi:hypothetical protein
MLKNLVIVFEFGITDFLRHIDMPEIKVIWLIYPHWLLWLLSRPLQMSYPSFPGVSDDSDDEGEDETNQYNSDNDQDVTSDGSDDGYIKHNATLAHTLVLHHEEERKKLSNQFPKIEVHTYDNHQQLDHHHFDRLPHLLLLGLVYECRHAF